MQMTRCKMTLSGEEQNVFPIVVSAMLHTGHKNNELFCSVKDPVALTSAQRQQEITLPLAR